MLFVNKNTCSFGTPPYENIKYNHGLWAFGKGQVIAGNAGNAIVRSGLANEMNMFRATSHIPLRTL